MAPYVYPRLAAAKRVAARLGLPEPFSSQRNGKKLYVVINKGTKNEKTIHFGARNYSDYLIHGDFERRQRYRARARGIMLANGKPAYMSKKNPAYYAYRILW